MARSKGFLGLAGGSLVIVILALAYIFTDRGREVGDRLGTSALERVDKLIAGSGEETPGEAGTTEPEGPAFTPQPPPELEVAPQRAHVPPAGVPGTGREDVIPREVPAATTRTAAAFAQLNARAQAASAAGTPIVLADDLPRSFTSASPAAAAFAANAETPGNYGYGQVGRFAGGFFSAGFTGFGAAAERSQAQARGEAPTDTSRYTPQTRAILGRLQGQAQAERAQQAATTTARAQASSPAPQQVRQEVQAAADRGRRLAVQRQTVSPSQTRPKQQTGGEILASYNAFRGAQLGRQRSYL